MDQVINHNDLRKVVSNLLHPDKESPEKYKVAQILAEEGLSYFINKSQNATQEQIDSIKAVIETTKQLTKIEISKDEHGEYSIKRRNPFERF